MSRALRRFQIGFVWRLFRFLVHLSGNVRIRLCNRLAAVPCYAATQPHPVLVIRHLASVIRHLPLATLPAAPARHAPSSFRVCRPHSTSVWATRSSSGQACLRAGFRHRQPSNGAASTTRNWVCFASRGPNPSDVNSLRVSDLWLISIGFVWRFFDDRLARTACCSVTPG